MPNYPTLTDEMCTKHAVRISWKRRTFSKSGHGEHVQVEPYRGMKKAKSVAESVRVASLGNIDAWAEVCIGRSAAGEIWQRVATPAGGRNG